MEEEAIEDAIRKANWYCNCIECFEKKGKTAEDKLSSEKDHYCDLATSKPKQKNLTRNLGNSARS